MKRTKVNFTLTEAENRSQSYEYIFHVRRILENWSLLSDRPIDLKSYSLLTSGLCHLPDSSFWKNHSCLCADGAPIEFCETLSNTISGPAYTIDPGPYQAPPLDRTFHALDLSESVLAQSKNEKGFHHTVGTIRTWISKNKNPERSFRLWLAVSCQEYGDPIIKLYLNFKKEFLKEILPTIEPLLRNLQRQPDGIGAPIMTLLAKEGYLKQIGVTLKPDGVSKVKLYYRLPRIDYLRLKHFCGVAQIPSHIFTEYVHKMLQKKSDWADRRSGIGIEMGHDGQCNALAFYHYTNKYFCNDEVLRERVEVFGRQCGWNLTRYRQICRLLQYDPYICQRPLLGFSATKLGGAGLRIYSSTGDLFKKKSRSSITKTFLSMNELAIT